jgi:hypothetical protein
MTVDRASCHDRPARNIYRQPLTTYRRPKTIFMQRNRIAIAFKFHGRTARKNFSVVRGVTMRSRSAIANVFADPHCCWAEAAHIAIAASRRDAFDRMRRESDRLGMA